MCKNFDSNLSGHFCCCWVLSTPQTQTASDIGRYSRTAPVARLWNTSPVGSPPRFAHCAGSGLLCREPWCVNNAPPPPTLGTIFVDKYPKWPWNSGFYFLLQVLLFWGCKERIHALQCLWSARSTHAGRHRCATVLLDIFVVLSHPLPDIWGYCKAPKPPPNRLAAIVEQGNWVS